MMTAIMVTIIVLFNAAGDVLISRGMKEVGDVSSLGFRELRLVAMKALTNKSFLLGVLALAVSFFSFLYVLSWAEMSFIVPVTSIVYVLSVFGAKVFLKEHISRTRWLGTLFVCLGVAVICLP